MLVAKLEDGRELKILFKHDRFLKENEQGKKVPLPHVHNRMSGKLTLITGETTCKVLEGPRDQEVVLSEAHSRCSYADNFRYDEARRIAFFRVLGLDPELPLGFQLDHPTEKLRFPIDVTKRLVSAYYSRKKKQRS